MLSGRSGDNVKDAKKLRDLSRKLLYCIGDWDNLNTDLHVSLDVDFKIQFGGIAPFFLELNGSTKFQFSRGKSYFETIGMRSGTWEHDVPQ